MSYLHYVAAAYAVFVVMLIWDLVVPRLQLRRQLRLARSHAIRRAQARSSNTSTEAP